MMYKKLCNEGTKFTPHTYRFIEPVRVRIRRPDGTKELIGFEIGETIQVMEPECQYLVLCYELLSEIPLVDGSVIYEYPVNMKVSMVRNGEN